MNDSNFDLKSEIKNLECLNFIGTGNFGILFYLVLFIVLRNMNLLSIVL